MLKMLVALAFLSSTETVAVQDEQVKCAEAHEMVKILKKEYGEEARGIGLSGEGYLWQVYVSPGGDSWSITITNSAGRMCIVETGESWTNDRIPGIDERAS